MPKEKYCYAEIHKGEKKMHIPATITEMIQILMQDYGFPEKVLARHFRLTA